jgi:hypothetical protein
MLTAQAEFGSRKRYECKSRKKNPKTEGHEMKRERHREYNSLDLHSLHDVLMFWLQNDLIVFIPVKPRKQNFPL